MGKILIRESRKAQRNSTGNIKAFGFDLPDPPPFQIKCDAPHSADGEKLDAPVCGEPGSEACEVADTAGVDAGQVDDAERRVHAEERGELVSCGSGEAVEPIIFLLLLFIQVLVPAAAGGAVAESGSSQPECLCIRRLQAKSAAPEADDELVE